MIGKFVSLFILHIIFIPDLVFSEKVRYCDIGIEGDTSVFSFINKSEDFIKNCLEISNKRIKWISIENCSITNYLPIFSAIVDFSAFEKLVIYNSGLSRLDFSKYNLPKLKIVNLSRNSLDYISLGKIPNLETLDLSFNKLDQLILTKDNLGKLQELNLFGNSFSSLLINLSAIRNINLADCLSANMSFVSVTIWNKFHSMDLSRNGLKHINFLSIKEDLNVLDLRDNNISSLADLFNLSQQNYHLQIYLSNNPLLCSPELSMAWLTLRNKNISFDGDLSCTFSQSKNTYSIKKYGWMFANEIDIHNEIWASTQLKTFLEVSSMGFGINVNTQGLSIMWTNRKTLNQKDLIQLKSVEDVVVYSVNIKMNETSGSTFISYKEVNRISKVCLLLSVQNLTRAGFVNAYINVRCTTLTDINKISKHDFRTLFIVFTVSLLVTCIALLLYIGYIHRAKLQKSNSINSRELELKPRVEQQISQNVQTTEFHNMSYMPSPCYTPSPDASPRPMLSNNSRLKLKPKPNLYLSMDHHDSYRISKTDNVYDGMDSITTPTISTSIRTTENECIYDYCET